MGLGLSLYALYQVARITAPTAVEAFAGTARREEHDRRLREFARRVIDRARIRLTVTGAEDVPLDRAFVYMSNHQSHVDIPVLYASVPSPTLRMVAKTELFRVPGFGRAMRAADMVEIDRPDRTRAVESLGRAASLIADRVSVWIAPEGSRSRTGQLARLKKGGFYLARDTATPIIPVAISGTYDILPPGSMSMTPDVAVDVVFGAPIAVEGRTIPELSADVTSFLAAHARRPARAPDPG